MVSGASAVRISTRRMSAVSCELFHTSSAWVSGESSSPTAAWIPPCALAELQDWRAALVATATRAPARSAATADARPDAPLPITSTSNWSASGTPGIYHRLATGNHFDLLSNPTPSAADKRPVGSLFGYVFMLAALA